MRRRLWTNVLAASAVLCLAACGGKDTATTEVSMTGPVHTEPAAVESTVSGESEQAAFAEPVMTTEDGYPVYRLQDIVDGQFPEIVYQSGKTDSSGKPVNQLVSYFSYDGGLDAELTERMNRAYELFADSVTEYRIALNGSEFDMFGLAQYLNREQYGIPVLEALNHTIPLHALELSFLDDDGTFVDYQDVLDEAYAGKTDADIQALVDSVMATEEFRSQYGKRLRIHLKDGDTAAEFCMDIDMRGAGDENAVTYITMIASAGMPDMDMSEDMLRYHSAYVTINGEKVCFLLDSDGGYTAYIPCMITR